MPKTPNSLPSQEERTLTMKQQYLKLRKDGLSIKRIANKFDLPTQTVIDCHREIYGDQPIPSSELSSSRPTIPSAPNNTTPKPQKLPRVDRSFNKQRNRSINACTDGLHDLIGHNFTYLSQENQRLARFKKEVSSWQQK